MFPHLTGQTTRKEGEFKPEKVYIETYGCQMNLVDSQIVLAMLEASGFETTDSPEKADVILVNTCVVREHAEEKVVSNIARFKRFKRNDPTLRVGVLGCLSSHAGEAVAKRLPFLDWILGPDAYRRLPDLIRKPAEAGPYLLTRGPEAELYEEILPARHEGVNAWVAISRGCDNHCTYCVVPGARGGERHRNVDSILREVEQAVEQGFPQVTLLGQNVNSYGYDGIDFPNLLARVAEIPGLERVRFITSHPKDCSRELLEVIGCGLPVCPGLHLPVQAGSDRILKRMGRNYTSGHYCSLVEMARELVPGLLLSTDIIVGFPGESDDDFGRTVELVEDIGFDDAFIYRYSERPGTAAEKFDDDVPKPEKISRLMELNKLVRRSGEARRRKLIGSRFPVLVEGPSAKSVEESMGRTPAGYVTVFPGKHEPGSVIEVELKRLSGFTLRGKAL